MPLTRQRFMSIVCPNSSGLSRWALAVRTALSKSMLFPAVKAVHSARHISSMPFAMRFLRAEGSSSVHSGKDCSSRWKPAKACPSVSMTSGFIQAASRQEA